jgi:hypothetical protein
VINQVTNSGARMATQLYLLNDYCTYDSLALYEPSPASESFSTIDALALANATPGSITYASIDYDGVMPNLTLASINSISPSAQAAVNGLYKWWYETTMQPGAITSSGGTALYNWLKKELSSVATVPHTPQVMAIAGAGTPANAVTLPAGSHTYNGQTVYINLFSRQAYGCNFPLGVSP